MNFITFLLEATSSEWNRVEVGLSNACDYVLASLPIRGYILKANDRISYMTTA